MSPDPAQDVIELIHNLIESDNRRDIEAVLACYADDVVWLPPDHPRVSGIGAIRARYVNLFGENYVEMQPHLDEVEVRGDMAYASGSTTGRLIPVNGGLPVTVDDKYVMLLTKYPDRGWLVRRLMWNRGNKSED